jgi:deoxyribose-phosphate aldolase
VNDVSDALTAEWLAGNVDISCVQAQHTRADVEALARTAVANGFVSAHVLPNRLPDLRDLLAGSAVLAGSPVGFPSGGASSATKFAEARELLEAGVQELDVVVNVGRLKSGEQDYCIEEVRRVVDLVAHSIPTRLILEVSLLDDDEVRRGCDVAVAAGVDYVKTGTGWQGPTTIDRIELIAGHLQGALKIKAAGGVRTLEDVRAMRDAGVVRFGINDRVAVALVHELRGAAA